MRHAAEKRARAPREAVRAQEAEPRRRRFAVAEYRRMAEVGILAPEERTELIDGEIVLMSPQGRAHLLVVSVLCDALRVAFGPGFFVVAPPVTQNRSKPGR